MQDWARYHELGQTLRSAVTVSTKLDYAGTLLKAQADVNYRDSHDHTPLMAAACQSSDNLERVKFLMANGATVDLADCSGCTAFYYAVRAGNLPTVKVLVEAGANVNQKGFKNRTAIMEAVKLNMLPMVKYLVEMKADLECVGGSWNKTILHYAARRGSVEMVTYLLENGAAVNWKDFFDRTPLHIVSIRGRLKIGQLLIQHGANVNCEDNCGTTPLYDAVLYQRMKVVKLLLANGADVDYTNRDDGETPLITALRYRRKNEMVLCLLEAQFRSNGFSWFRDCHTFMEFPQELQQQCIVLARLQSVWSNDQTRTHVTVSRILLHALLHHLACVHFSV